MTLINNKLESNSSQKLKSFSKKYARPAPPVPSDDAPVPAPKDDIFDRLDLANKLEYDNSVNATIDFFPDTRYIFVFIIFNVMKLYRDNSSKVDVPLLTPSSFVAYCLIQLYAFALINDYHGRPDPSYSANDFMNNDQNRQLFESLCLSYVPPFMLTIYHALADTTDPRRPGLSYFCTLAGSIFQYDFGRYIPFQALIHAHNISTEADTSRDVDTALRSILSSVLFYQDAAKTDDDAIRVGNYFSAGFSAQSVARTFMFDALKTLFSPVTGKSLLRRSNIEDIPITPYYVCPTGTSQDEFSNQYSVYLNALESNSRSTKRFVDSFSVIAKSIFNAQFQLGAVPDDLNGVNALVHGISSFSRPSFHSVMIKTSLEPPTKKKNLTVVTEENYAKALKFMQPVSFTSKTTTTQPKDRTNLLSDLYLIGEDTPSDKTNPDKPIQFDPELHVAPRTLYLDPYTSGDGPISYAMLAGMLIETDEIDGSSVPAPNPNAGLSINNKQFLQGALPLSSTRTAFTTSGQEPYNIYPRSILKNRDQKISHDLYATESNRLGQFGDSVTESIPGATPYGFTLVKTIWNHFRMFNKLSFSTAKAPTEISIHAWSPYRYVASQDDDFPAPASTYTIINFRALYGTHIPLVASRHPSTVIPLS